MLRQVSPAGTLQTPKVDRSHHNKEEVIETQSMLMFVGGGGGARVQ